MYHQNITSGGTNKNKSVCNCYDFNGQPTLVLTGNGNMRTAKRYGANPDCKYQVKCERPNVNRVQRASYNKTHIAYRKAYKDQESGNCYKFEIFKHYSEYKMLTWNNLNLGHYNVTDAESSEIVGLCLCYLSPSLFQFGWMNTWLSAYIAEDLQLGRQCVMCLLLLYYTIYHSQVHDNVHFHVIMTYMLSRFHFFVVWYYGIGL